MTYEFPDLRTVEEIIDQISDQIVKGYKPVFEEAVIFATGTDAYELYCEGESIKKAYDILLVRGERSGIEHTFVSQSDYLLTDEDGDGYYDHISWSPGGDDPDDDTTFYVDYRYIIEPSGLTDITDGSVLLTIVDAVALQLYKTELKLNEIAKDSFIDSADGLELDELGKIAGVDRNEAIQATGFVSMSRPASMASGHIDIPIGTQVSTSGTSTVSPIIFETTIAGEILNTETDAKIADAGDVDYQKTWIAVQAVFAGADGNVSTDTIIKNVSANSVITTITNPSTYDQENEVVTGTGTAQVFAIAHPADENGLVDKDGDGKAIEVIDEDVRGWMAQPSASGTCRVEIDGAWTGACTIVGYDGVTDGASEVLNFIGAGAGENFTTTTSFTYIYYITFTGASGGLGAVEANVQCPAANHIVGNAGTYEPVDARVDSGFTALRDDGASYLIEVYDAAAWNDTTGSWTRTSVNIDTYARTYFTWTAGLANWEATYGSDGTRKLRFSYVPSALAQLEDQYAVDGDELELLWPLVDGSYLEIDYTWDNLFIDGADVETDDSYRDRIKTGLIAIAKGTLAAITAAVLAVDGIAGANVDDFSTDSTIAIGEVDVFAWTAAGTLSAAKKSEVTAAVEAVRAAGIKVTIDGPDPIYMAFNATVKVPQDQGYTLATVKAACDAAVIQWINAYIVGQDIYESELIDTLQAVPGVSYVDVTTTLAWGYDSPSDVGVSTREPYPGGWTFANPWNKVSVNSGDIAKADTDSAGEEVDITAEFE